MSDMPDSGALAHLRKMKRRLNTPRTTDTGNGNDLSDTVEKVNLLEKTLSVFRAEVDMKLQIMQQILATRNEQVSVHKKLLEREQSLYNSLLGHWENASDLAASGLSLNFSAPGKEDLQNCNESSFDDLGPIVKKSRSSLRRRRKSVYMSRNDVKHKQEGIDESTEGAEDSLGVSNDGLCDEESGNDGGNIGQAGNCDVKWEDEAEISNNASSDSDSLSDENEEESPPKKRNQGRPKDRIWKYFSKCQGSTSARICIKCKKTVSAQANRLKKHYDRCSKEIHILPNDTPSGQARSMQAESSAFNPTKPYQDQGSHTDEAGNIASTSTGSWQSMLVEDDETGTVPLSANIPYSVNSVSGANNDPSQPNNPTGRSGRPSDPIWQHYMEKDGDLIAKKRTCIKCNKKVTAQAPRLRKHFEKCSNSVQVMYMNDE